MSQRQTCLKDYEQSQSYLVLCVPERVQNGQQSHACFAILRIDHLFLILNSWSKLPFLGLIKFYSLSTLHCEMKGNIQSAIGYF